MMKILTLILLLLITVSIAFANPFLIAEPLEDTDYYFISIDGVETYVAPSMDFLFLYSISDLMDGTHEIDVVPYHEEWGEGQCVTFNIIEDCAAFRHVYFAGRTTQSQDFAFHMRSPG